MVAGVSRAQQNCKYVIAIIIKHIFFSAAALAGIVVLEHDMGSIYPLSVFADMNGLVPLQEKDHQAELAY